MNTPTREQVSKLFKGAINKRREMSEESKGGIARWLFSEGMAVARADLEATIAEQAAEIERLKKLAEQLEAACVYEATAWATWSAEKTQQLATLQSKADALVIALDKAAKHVRPTCFALYEELQAALATYKESKQ